MNKIWEDMSKEELCSLLENASKNWLAMDGVWFQAVESRWGMDAAMDCDVEIWERFTVIEAKRIKQFLGLPEHPGLDGLEKALRLRFYANMNLDEFIREDNKLTYRILRCRVQYARQQKGMELHPCKSVGIPEYSLFAREIDDRIECRCVSCYPEITDESCNCSWEFTLKE